MSILAGSQVISEGGRTLGTDALAAAVAPCQGLAGAHYNHALSSFII